MRAVERLLQQGDVAGAVRLGWAGNEEELEMATGREPACCKCRVASAVLHVPALWGAGFVGSRLLADPGRLGHTASGVGPPCLLERSG